MEKNEKYLIKNTTRAQREAIVRKSLGGEGCSGCSGCDGIGCGDAFEIYQEYIACRNKPRFSRRNGKLIKRHCKNNFTVPFL